MKERTLVLNNKKTVTIFGGTGFIGSFATDALLNEGFNVVCISRDSDMKKNDLVKGADLEFVDLDKVSEDSLVHLLSGSDYFIFAAGADDRYVPKSPAIDFFRKANVESTKKVIRAAKKAGVRKGIIITSYFGHFARKHPEWKLTDYHPYIKSRIEQEDAAVAEADKNFSVVILQLPYVIGAMKGKGSLFKPLIQYCCSSFPTFFMKGGTAVISVKQIAEAIVQTFKKDLPSSIYPIATKNYSWDQFIQKINPQKKKIIHIPTFLLKIFGFFVNLFYRIQGKEGGLNILKYVDIQTKELFLDTTELLLPKIEQKELDLAFTEMVKESTT